MLACQEIEETSFYKTCRECHVNDERPTGKKITTTEWDDGGIIGNKHKSILCVLKTNILNTAVFCSICITNF